MANKGVQDNMYWTLYMDPAPPNLGSTQEFVAGFDNETVELVVALSSYAVIPYSR
jgi:hypothetical protein